MMLLMIQIMKMWEIMILITFPLKSTSARLVSRSAPDSSRNPEFCPQNWTEPELWLVTAKQNMKFWWLWRTLCRQLCRSLCPSWITAAALLAVYSRAGREWASPASDVTTLDQNQMTEPSVPVTVVLFHGDRHFSNQERMFCWQTHNTVTVFLSLSLESFF